MTAIFLPALTLTCWLNPMLALPLLIAFAGLRGLERREAAS